MARIGFTTGSCSAAAAKASTYMLLTGKKKESITIETPKGIIFHAKLEDINREEEWVSCCVIKDGGDDPDITTGAHIYAKVSYLEHADKRVCIQGGRGVGLVTKPGLDQPVGAHAINSVPRKMIEKEVLQVMDLCDYKGSLLIEISVPEGCELAGKTFNPRLGIEGGISILGTSGIVEPMSSQAILDTIRVELAQKTALGWDYIPVSPGNYGLEFMKRTYGFDLDQSVKCSNFVGDTIEMAKQVGCKGILFTGHIGKLVKIAGGMMNTHSKYGDCRMQVLAECAGAFGAKEAIRNQLLQCAVTEDAVDLLSAAEAVTEGERLLYPKLKRLVMDEVMQRIMQELQKAAGTMQIECMMYSNKHGLLAASSMAPQMLQKIQKELGKENNVPG